MINPRRYGSPPFSVAVIHGGPGAGGEMALVAEELCSDRGILEPLQTAHTLWDQVDELKGLLPENARLPVTLIGFSWGAWLSFILAARYPAMVKKLVLVGSGPFQEKYAPRIMQTRLSRLDERERSEVRSILTMLDQDAPHNDNSDYEMDRMLARLGEILSRTDAFDPVECESLAGGAIMPCRADIYQSVWKEAEILRRKGDLLQLGRRILCPVIAIHGDWDPHPAEGVSEPLQATLRSFQFILLHDCGHMPWRERRAKAKFYSILKGLIE
ncbi:MAG: alpha/beta hydrolase [Methanotrichaceae archaeon]|nr:alpha/beta hydrolase [Methanotrichaceae archaeon]